MMHVEDTQWIAVDRNRSQWILVGYERHRIRDTGYIYYFQQESCRNLSDVKVVPKSGACTDTHPIPLCIMLV